MATNIAVYGLYDDREHVEKAVDSLKAAGFRNTDISVLFPEQAGSKTFAHEKSTKLPEGAAAGGATGSVIGGALVHSDTADWKKRAKAILESTGARDIGSQGEAKAA